MGEVLVFRVSKKMRCESMADTVVLYPSPQRGHIVSMVELGRLLTTHHPSISITIIILTLPKETITTNSYIATVSATTPSIDFLHLPTVSLPPFNPSSYKDNVASFFELVQFNNPNLHHALSTLSNSVNIKAFIIDFFCNSAFEVSSTLNIPTYYYYTSNASSLCHFLYTPIIHKNVPNSLKDVDILIDVPGTPSLPSKHVPPVIIDRSHKVYKYFLDTAVQMAKSAGIVVNSFESLEPRAIKAVVDGQCTPDQEAAAPLYCVGPVVSSSTVETKEEHECLSWLDSQPNRSVVFLCFGSMGVFSTAQLKEMAIGLEKSGFRFLWVVRDLPPKSETNGMLCPKEPNLESLLPDGFLERTKDRGFVVKSWAPQVEILNHDSVGVFVTHCGWNSILESVCAGVPMLGWPLYAEQKMNGFFLVEELKLGLAMTESKDGSVSAAELELRLMELTNSEKGKAIRKRVRELREAAIEAVSEGGASRVGLAHLVDSFKTGLNTLTH